MNASTITREGRSVTEDDTTFSFPFTFQSELTKNTDASFTLTTSVNQGYLTTTARRSNGVTVYTDETSNQVASQIVTAISATFQSTITYSSSQHYATRNSRGYCYSRTLTSANMALTGYQDGEGCPTTASRGDLPDQ